MVARPAWAPMSRQRTHASAACARAIPPSLSRSRLFQIFSLRRTSACIVSRSRAAPTSARQLSAVRHRLQPTGGLHPSSNWRSCAFAHSLRGGPHEALRVALVTAAARSLLRGRVGIPADSGFRLRQRRLAHQREGRVLLVAPGLYLQHGELRRPSAAAAGAATPGRATIPRPTASFSSPCTG